MDAWVPVAPGSVHVSALPLISVIARLHGGAGLRILHVLARTGLGLSETSPTEPELFQATANAREAGADAQLGCCTVHVPPEDEWHGFADSDTAEGV